MPLRDGTGPAGMGPMTGRGMGPCAGGYGRGMGRGAGRGRGCGMFGPWAGWSYTRPTVDDEKIVVKEDIEILKEELKAAQERLNELESKNE